MSSSKERKQKAIRDLETKLNISKEEATEKLDNILVVTGGDIVEAIRLIEQAQTPVQKPAPQARENSPKRRRREEEQMAQAIRASMSHVQPHSSTPRASSSSRPRGSASSGPTREPWDGRRETWKGTREQIDDMIARDRLSQERLAQRLGSMQPTMSNKTRGMSEEQQVQEAYLKGFMPYEGDDPKYPIRGGRKYRNNKKSKSKHKPKHKSKQKPKHKSKQKPKHKSKHKPKHKSVKRHR